MAWTLVLAVLGCLLLGVNGNASYSKNSPVLQVSGRTYDSLIARSNHTSLLEFYAPWCTHCAQMKPAYERAAKLLNGLVKVAAVNCDDEANRPLCAQMGVQAFPVVKIIRPNPRSGRPIIEDYRGARTAQALYDTAIEKISNHVKRVEDGNLDAWLEEGSPQAKLLLFTDKGVISPLLKALAIDFLGKVGVAQIKTKNVISVEKYGVTKPPTILLFPSPGAEPLTYTGETKKDAILSFIAPVAMPNPDPAPSTKKSKSTPSSKSTPKRSAKASAAASDSFSRASKQHKTMDLEKDFVDMGTVTLSDPAPTESPLPIIEQESRPKVIPEAAPQIPSLATPGDVEAACLKPESGTCLLVLTPLQNEESLAISGEAATVIQNLGTIAAKHSKRGAKLFPTFSIPAENEISRVLRNDLGLEDESHIQIFALNVKRNWWRPLKTSAEEITNLEDFIDSIKLGGGSRQSLPEYFGRKEADLEYEEVEEHDEL